jgi:hypothetical protein
VADGNGNTVNNWDSGVIKRVALTRQQSGYVGWVSPALLGSGVSNGAKNANPDYQAGIGTAAPDKVYPLPKPQRERPLSGLAIPFWGYGSLTLLGKDLKASIGQLVDSARLDAGSESVAQLSLTSHDPSLALSTSELARIGSTLRWSRPGSDSLWDVSTVDVSAADATVTINARSRLAKRLRRKVDVRSTRKVSPSEWVTRTVIGAGGIPLVQKSQRKGEITQSDGTTEWDMLAGLAGSLGWSFVEYGGTVMFGSRHWAWSGGLYSDHWKVTWGRSPDTDVLDAQLSLTADDPDNVAVGGVVLPWNRGIRLRPWDTLELVGLGRWDGVWLVEQISASTDGISAVDVQIAQPRKPAPDTGTKSTSSSTRSDTPPTRDRTSVAWAKWFARQEMSKAKWGWGSDEQWAALENLWTRESGWSYTAENASSGAYGIPQALPPDKMSKAGKDWKTNPATQILWGLGYIKERYGGPKRAWAHFQAKGWY